MSLVRDQNKLKNKTKKYVLIVLYKLRCIQLHQQLQDDTKTQLQNFLQHISIIHVDKQFMLLNGNDKEYFGTGKIVIVLPYFLGPSGSKLCNLYQVKFQNVMKINWKYLI